MVIRLLGAMDVKNSVKKQNKKSSLSSTESNSDLGETTIVLSSSYLPTSLRVLTMFT